MLAFLWLSLYMSFSYSSVIQRAELVRPVTGYEHNAHSTLNRPNEYHERDVSRRTQIAYDICNATQVETIVGTLREALFWSRVCLAATTQYPPDPWIDLIVRNAFGENLSLDDRILIASRYHNIVDEIARGDWGRLMLACGTYSWPGCRSDRRMMDTQFESNTIVLVRVSSARDYIGENPFRLMTYQT